MGQRSEDVLVRVLNIDAEIRGRLDRLAEMERSAEGRLAPWVDQARSVLRTDLGMLRARREEQFLRLTGLAPCHQPGQAQAKLR
ncbi:hypothetical protein M3I53_35870 [Paraburkholderia sp. CNPSo 3272]|uniref:hypothetical protein n=1 Tax=Paraburkholderia sp. CNPSo 3272 TaxID=2940931 RepID=UPI0020B7F42E|nr:hypothetical protein [Paraburkholderia sp. CNPSo 3272]MCP3728427.1 hypothetical protein [Paraburkholderia sp. CNPSo 3272]